MNRNFDLISTAIDVGPALAQLNAQPDLWNARPERRASLSPHRETQDIWVRWRDPAELKAPSDYGSPHFAVFWPAWHALPALRSIVFPLFHAMQATYLGGILITKIPAGCQVYPHHDRGGWHAEFMNCKIYVPLQAPDECVNWCEDEGIMMKAGEAWRFNNLLTHSVVNGSPDVDRITLIVCMRLEE